MNCCVWLISIILLTAIGGAVGLGRSSPNSTFDRSLLLSQAGILLMASRQRFLSPSVDLRVVEWVLVQKLLPRSSVKLLLQAAPPASLLLQRCQLRSASLFRTSLLRCRSLSHGVQALPTLVHAKTEWSLKISTKPLDCEYEPRHLLGRTTNNRNVYQPPTKLEPQGHPQPQMRIHPGMSSHPVLSLHAPSPPHLHHSNFLIISFVGSFTPSSHPSSGLLCIRPIHPAVHWIHWKDFLTSHFYEEFSIDHGGC